VSTKFNPCPFCGSTNIGVHDRDGLYFAMCGHCTAEGPSVDNKAHVVGTWNGRTPSSTPTAGGERQSIWDDEKFRALMHQYQKTPTHTSKLLVAHIDAWAGRSAGAKAESNQAHVMPPTRGTGSQQEITRLDLLSLIHSQCHRAYASAIDREDIDTKYMAEIESAVKALYADAEVASRCRAQGGNTSNESNSEVAAPTNTAPAVQPEPVDKRADAEVLRDLTKEYDAYMADRAALVMGQSFIEWKDSRMRRGQNSASNGATGESNG
jgi:Lar family restriction alleviation protein